MDSRGDHATICKSGFGVVHRHNTVRNTFARQVFKPAGIAYSLEVPSLIPNTALSPADILVQPSPPPPGSLPDKPIAYDVTVRSPYRRGVIHRAALKRAGAAEAADEDKLRTLQRTLRNALLLQEEAPIPDLDWQFIPLAYDSLGAPSIRTSHIIEDHARRIALRSCISFSSAKSRILQRISYAIWSSTASAILARMPSHVADLSHPLQV